MAKTRLEEAGGDGCAVLLSYRKLAQVSDGEHCLRPKTSILSIYMVVGFLHPE